MKTAYPRPASVARCNWRSNPLILRMPSRQESPLPSPAARFNRNIAPSPISFTPPDVAGDVPKQSDSNSRLFGWSSYYDSDVARREICFIQDRDAHHGCVCDRVVYLPRIAGAVFTSLEVQNATLIQDYFFRAGDFLTGLAAA